MGEKIEILIKKIVIIIPYLMEQLAKNLATLPIETVQAIRYEFANSPKSNYDAVIAYLKDTFEPSCGNGCRFNKFFMVKGKILKIPVLVRTCIKSCIMCEYPVEDFNYTYCHVHALEGLDFERYHRYCNNLS